MRGVDDYLLAKLVGSVSCADEPILEASMEMARKLAPGRQSCRVNAGAGARYQVAGFGGPPPSLAAAQLGTRGAARLRCLVGRGVIADADAIKAA
jgi:hypothetical protein